MTAARITGRVVLHGNDFYMGSATTRADLTAENPAISDAEWRDAVKVLRNAINHHLLYPSAGTARLEAAARRGGALLNKDARALIAGTRTRKSR